MAFRFGLKSKLLILFGCSMVALIGLVAFMGDSAGRALLIKNDHDRALAVAVPLGAEAIRPLIFDDKFALFQLLQRAVAIDGVTRSYLLDPQGNIIMSDDLSEVDTRHRHPQVLAALPNEAPEIISCAMLNSGKGPDQILIPLTIAGERLGTMVLAYSHERMLQDVAMVRRQILFLSGLALTGGTILALAAAISIVRPLRRLIELTGKVGAGNLQFESSGFPKDEVGELANAFGRMLAKLRETTVSADYLDAVFHCNAAAIRVIEPGFKISVANTAMAKLVCRNSFPETSKCHQLLQMKICGTPDCFLVKVLSGASNIESVLPARKAGGEEIIVRVLATPLIEQGEIRGVIESFHDITAERIAAQEQNRLRSQLIQAQKMEPIGRLTSGIAHDFNNILTVILGYTDWLLLQTADQGEIRESLEAIKAAGRKATALTRHLLVFSRNQTLEKHMIDLNELLENFSKMLGRLLGENIVVDLNLEKPLATVYADMNQLEQVVMNLAVNARDAMPEGGCFRISTRNLLLTPEAVPPESKLRPGRFVEFAAADTGTGMTAVVQSRIFEPFFTTKGRDDGTGLGLTTVNEIVEQHGGHIDFVSAPGEGTTFRILLPAAMMQGSSSLADDDPEELPRGHETVLVVDDYDEIRQVLVGTLRRLGYQVRAAASAKEALTVFEDLNGAVDLLVADVVMADVNGPRLAEELFRLQPALKTIFISGYGHKINSLVPEETRSKLNSTFLLKPFSASQLAMTVRKALDQHASSV